VVLIPRAIRGGVFQGELLENRSDGASYYEAIVSGGGGCGGRTRVVKGVAMMVAMMEMIMVMTKMVMKMMMLVMMTLALMTLSTPRT
jgi:hypothetical protein